MVKGLLLQHYIIAFARRRNSTFFYKHETSVMKGKVFEVEKVQQVIWLKHILTMQILLNRYSTRT